MDLDIYIIFQADFIKVYFKMIKKLMGLKWMIPNYTMGNMKKTKGMEKEFLKPINI